MNTELKNKLESYGQTHLLSYYDAMNPDEQTVFEQDLEKLDWGLFDCFHQTYGAGKDEVISPIAAMTMAAIRDKEEAFSKIGLDAIKRGEIGALLLAGGQGTRLGWNGPKGTYDVGMTKHLYIFECLFKNTMAVTAEAGRMVPFYIMTSEINHEETVRFLKEHEFFGYAPELVHFFKQKMAPAMDFDKKLLMGSRTKLVTSPNGNGGWFTSFAQAGLLAQAKADGVKWLNVFSVDNVLQRILDPCFIGAVYESGYPCGSKVVSKADPEERVGVMCLRDGKPSIIEYYEMTREMNYAKDAQGNYLYNYGVILNYLFRMDKLEDIMNNRMQMHIVQKKVPYVDADGTKHAPETPNAYKFEALIVDQIAMMDECLPYEVEREKEFAPVKNASGTDSVDTARALLQKNGVEI